MRARGRLRVQVRVCVCVWVRACVRARFHLSRSCHPAANSTCWLATRNEKHLAGSVRENASSILRLASHLWVRHVPSSLA